MLSGNAWRVSIGCTLCVITVGLLGWYWSRGGSVDPQLDGLPVHEFGFELAREFDAPPDGGFWMPMDIAVTPERVWIVDYKAGRFYEYTRDGRYRRTIGRSGSGPGELKGPSAIGVLGDTVWVLNTGNSRVDYFSTDGRLLGSQPLPKEAEGAGDMVAVGGDFVATSLFRPLPLLRFPRRPGNVDASTGVTAFGGALIQRAQQIQGNAKLVPPSYRLHRRGEELWVMHTYLPLVGVYDTLGANVQLITYPAPQIGSGRVETHQENGVERRVIMGPEPVGSVGLLWLPDRTAYLLTQQKSSKGAQRLYQIAVDGTVLAKITSPFSALIGFGASDSQGSYAIGIHENTGEVDVYLLRWQSSQ